MAVKLLQMGFYSSDIRGIMPLGLSNAMGLPIVIFNSNSEIPLLHIIPRAIKDSSPLFLTYNDGHYDYAFFCCDATENGA